MNQPFDWKKEQAFVVLSQISQELREECIQIARTNSPTSAKKAATAACQLAGIRNLLEMGAIEKATGRLAMIRRDHGEEVFEEVVRDLMLPMYIPTPYGAGPYLGQLSSGQAVFDRANSHRHKGVTVQLLSTAFNQISLEKPGRHSIEVNFGQSIGFTTCVPTAEGDEIVYAQRPDRKGLTRFVKNQVPIPTSILTLILQKADEGDFYILVTAFIGVLIAPEPWDRFATEQSKIEWRTHALIWGSEKIVPGTETTDVPWYFV